MFSAVVSITLASTFAFSPYAVGRMSARMFAPAPAPTAVPEPTDPTAPAPAQPAPSGWDDEPIAPAPAPAPAPVVAPAIPVPEEHHVARPDTRSGIGLMIGAGVAGAAAWGLAIGKIAAVGRCADEIDAAETGTATDAQVTAWDCFTQANAILGMSIVGWFANWASWGLAAGAGVVRGRHDGVGYAWDGKPDRASAGFIAGGAATMGVGIIGLGLTRILALTEVLKCPATTEFDDCAKPRLSGYFAGVQVSSTMVAAGIGLMVYGIVYRKNRNQFEKRTPRVSNLQVAPDVSRFRGSGGGYMGLALTGRF